ncbi:hypothetical protein ACFWNK_01875 [Streptomyces sp. NPDC058417]|uniref:hypothetical protein n=1 Tax=unclassified Streptomyces TaxID=2593676 RepID=UPI003648092B
MNRARTAERLLAAWVARGRRHDLTGWRAELGCWARAALLLAALGALIRLCWTKPQLLWVASIVGLIGAWWLSRDAPAADQEEDPVDSAGEPPAHAPGQAVRHLLLDLMGKADAVHLRTVLAHLQEHGQWEGRTVTDLRAHLAHLGVPCDRGVKVAGVPTWGVRRRDLTPPRPAAPQETASAPSTAA